MAHYCPVVDVVTSLQSLARIGSDLSHDQESVFDTLGALSYCINALWPNNQWEYCSYCGTHGSSVRMTLAMLWLDVILMTLGCSVHPLWVGIHDTEATLALLKALFQPPVFNPAVFPVLYQ